MRNSVWLCLVLAGCLSQSYTAPPGGPGPDPGSVDMAGPGNPGASDLAGPQGAPGVSGTLSADTTWTGDVAVSGDVTVPSGVTLTVAAGANVTFAGAANVIIGGKMSIQGTSASPVTLTAANQASAWGGLTVQSGGSLDSAYATLSYTVTPLTTFAGATLTQLDHTQLLHYTGVGAQIAAPATFTYVRVEFGGSDGITVNAGPNDLVTITDSTFHMTGGDATVVNAGNLTFNHNAAYGDTPGGALGVHCACHYASTGTYLVDHNDFYNASYGFMASNMGAASKVNENNFYANGLEWGSADGNPVNAGVDLTNNYWGGGAPPTIQGNSRTTPYSTTKITGTGPR